jgi:predicted dehydrogenase
MTRPVSLAVVGAGYWGPNLVRNIVVHPRTRLRWIVDRDPHRAENLAARHGDVPWTTSLDQVLADPDLDAVAIATPAATHGDIAHAVLDSGRHVLIEKPLAASLDEGRALADAAARSDRILMCDHTYCYTPAVRRLHSAVASGELGDLHYVDSVRINLGLVQSDVDVFWDLAPHDLSILELVLPPNRRILTVSAHGADPLGTGRISVGHLTLGLDGGALAHVHVNWLSPTKVRTSVWGGSQRTLVWDDLDPVHRLRLYDRGVVVDGGPEPRIAYRIGDMTSPALGEREALATMLDEFCDAIAEHRSPLTGADAGLTVLDILTAAHSSLDEGGIAIPLSGPAPVATPPRRGLEPTPTEDHRPGDPLSRRSR